MVRISSRGSVPVAVQTIGVNSKGYSTEWVEGRAFASSPQYALCRCGQSKSKPFCDGTHTEVGFDGTETASHAPVAQQANVLDGPTMQLLDAEVYVHSHAFAIRTVEFGTRWKEPAMNEYVSNLYVK